LPLDEWRGRPEYTKAYIEVLTYTSPGPGRELAWSRDRTIVRSGGKNMMGQTPILILKEGTKREKGKGAQFNNITAARAIADSVRSTLGPRGMDKMLVDSMGDVVITNDGVTILKEIDVEHPAAKMLVEVAKTQDDECGDGTTTAVILAGELLKKAEALIERNVHPTVISGGFRMAAQKAQDILEELAIKVSPDKRDVLMDIARTAMISKSVSSSRDLLSAVAVDAVSAVAEKKSDGTWTVDDDNIQVVKKQGGSMDDTQMIAGIIVDKEAVHPAMPKRVEKAKIALVDSALEVKKTEIDAKIEITDPSQLHAFLDEEENMLRKMVGIVKKSGANVLFCQKGIDDLAQHYLSKEGIYAVRRVKKSDMEKLAKATGSNLVTKLDDLRAGDLGIAKLVEEKKIAEDRMTFVTGCKNPKAVSVLIRGGTEHVIDEIDRSLNDAISVVAVAVEDGKLVTGGGSTATELAQRMRDYAASVGGREQMAIDAFASALEVVPTALAENAGLDPIDILIELRKAHKSGKVHAGINVLTGKVTDMKKERVFEPLRVGKQGISSATDAAVMILRIDDVIASRSGGAGGKSPQMPDMGDGGFD
jgi:thermosome